MKELEDKFSSGTIADGKIEKLLCHVHRSLCGTRRARHRAILFKKGLHASMKEKIMTELLGLPTED